MTTAHAASRLLSLAVAFFCLAAPAFCGLISESFDSLVAPALPAGWTATNAIGPAPFWVSQTGANCYGGGGGCLFIDAPDFVSDKRIITPVMVAGGSTVDFSFRNQYNLETFHDGGVFEVSFNGGAFVDVAGVAGFINTSDWYSNPISTGSGSPIEGRWAWTGASISYGLTSGSFTADPSDSLQFQFRMASNDTFTYAHGWWIDDVTISGGGDVPEPSTWLLASLPLAGLLLLKLRR